MLSMILNKQTKTKFLSGLSSQQSREQNTERDFASFLFLKVDQ